MPLLTTEDRERLKSLLLEHSVRTGEFTLASGQKSNIYVDCKMTTLRGEAMPLVGQAILDAMAARGWQPAAVGGLTLGADPMAYAVAREAYAAGLPVNAFVIRKESKGHGTNRYVEGLPSLDGVPVVILEDVCTTGGSAIKAIVRARESGLNVIGAVCLVDREKGGREAIEEDNDCPLAAVFQIGDLVDLTKLEYT